MGMATFTDDQNQISREFKELNAIYESLKNDKVMSNSIQTLSMGMSGDYKLAIDCGSNMVRIGSSIFGGR